MLFSAQNVVPLKLKLQLVISATALKGVCRAALQWLFCTCVERDANKLNTLSDKLSASSRFFLFFLSALNVSMPEAELCIRRADCCPWLLTFTNLSNCAEVMSWAPSHCTPLWGFVFPWGFVRNPAAGQAKSPAWKLSLPSNFAAKTEYFGSSDTGVFTGKTHWRFLFEQKNL